MQQKQPQQPAPQRSRRQVVRACGRARAHRCTHREAELRRVRVRPEQRLAERHVRSCCGVSAVLPRSPPLDGRRRGPWILRLTDRLHRNGGVRVASRLVGPVGLVEVLWRHSRQSPSRRPGQRQQLQGPFRVHLCGEGGDQSDRLRRKRRARGERGVGAGAPASLRRRLLQRASPPLLAVFPTPKGMWRLGGQRETAPGPELV